MTDEAADPTGTYPDWFKPKDGGTCCYCGQHKTLCEDCFIHHHDGSWVLEHGEYQRGIEVPVCIRR